VTEQLLELLLTDASVHPAPGAKPPLPELLKVTAPLGLDAPAPAVSVTVTVQALP
jgi:hypothetical protein